MVEPVGPLEGGVLDLVEALPGTGYDRGAMKLGNERSRSVVHSDPKILGGTPVFRGTRVPVQALFDYVEAGDPLERFLDHFPSVTRDQAVAVLEEAARLVSERAATSG